MSVATILVEPAPRDRSPVPALAVLAGAGLAELLLQRTFYRVGIFIPKDGPFGTVYRTGTALGSLAYNLASVLVVAGLAMIAVRLIRAGHGVTAGLVASFAILGLGARALGNDPAVVLLLRALFVVAALAIAAPALRRTTPWSRTVTAGLLVVFGCSAYYGISNALMRLTGSAGTPPGADGVLAAGEMAIVALGPVFFAWWRATSAGGQRRIFAWAAIPAIGFLLPAFMQPRMTGILVLWTVGLSFTLPVGLYALSLWLYCAAAIGSFHRPETRARGLALILLLVGGYFPQSTYELMVSLAALALWASPPLVWAGRSSTRPAAAATSN